MKTSKKLLSFFLAVVMVVTTCSVGFTAFAQDNKNSIWSTSSEAEDAFNALNGLADDVLPGKLIGGIPSVKTAVYGKYAKIKEGIVKDKGDVSTDAIALTPHEMDVIAGLADATAQDTDNGIKAATLQDILGVLQPVLLNALKGTSQSAYVTDILGSTAKGDTEYYNYLVKDDENAMSFFTLYALCNKYQGNRNLSAETRKTLRDWYLKLNTIANIGFVDETADVIMKHAKKYNGVGYDYTKYNEATLFELELFYNDEYMAKVTESDMATIEFAYNKYNKELESYSCDIKIDSLAELVYYTVGMGQNLKYAYAYYDLIKLTGTTVTLTGNYYDLLDWIGSYFDYNITEDITPENFVDLFIKHTVAADTGKDVSTLDAKDAVSLLEWTESYPEYYYEYFKSYTIKAYIETVLSNYYREIVAGLAMKYSGKVTSIEQFNSMVDAKMPAADADGNVLTVDEIKEMASFLKTIGAANTTLAEKLFADGNISATDPTSVACSVNYTLPDNIKGTYFSEYISKLFIGDTGSSLPYQSARNASRDKFNAAFFSEFRNPFYPAVLNPEGNPATSADLNGGNVARYPESNLVMLNYNNGAKYSLEDIAKFADDAKTYAYTSVAAELLGIKDLKHNPKTGVMNTVLDYKSFVESKAVFEKTGVVLTEDEKAILNADYDLTGEVGTELLNFILNDTIVSLLKPSDEGEKGAFDIAGTINALLTDLLGTSVNLVAAIEDIWQRLYDSPVATVFELLPILVVAVDSLIVPVIFNGDGDKFYNFLGPTLEMVLPLLTPKAIMAKNGSYIGIEQIGWDLNTLLPQLMDWLFEGKNAENITYWTADTLTVTETIKNPNDQWDMSIEAVVYNANRYNDIDFKHYTIVDENNIELKEITNDDGTTSYTYAGNSYDSLEDLFTAQPKAQFNALMTYESNVPYLTGIYIADKALRDAKIADIGKLLAKATKNETLGAALGETVTELATLFRAAVKQFLADGGAQQVRYAADGVTSAVSGLNNLFVAIPQLLDIMENLAAEKYDIPQDAWTYCYEGKIYTEENSNGNVNTYNKVLEDIKAYSNSSDPKRSVEILDWFTNLFIGDWLNAIFSIANNVVTTDNEISNALPIVTGLLNSLGGFSEASILTDIFNGVFQIDRSSDYSFTFEKQENGFTGLSENNAYFLISNASTLVEVIKNLIGKFGTKSETTAQADEPAVAAVTPKANQLVPALPSNADNSNYTDDELSNASDLINNVDKMVSSLLADSSLNGFNLNEVDNIFAGVITLFSNYLGNDCYTDVAKLVNSYVYYITGSETHTPDSKGNVDDKKVYTNDTLTGLVVETFLLTEKLVEKLLDKFDDTYTLDNASKAQYNLLVEAIEGLISPDAIGYRLDGYDKVQKKLADYNCWHNAAAQTSRGDYKIKLDWGIKAGDKDAFFNGLAASLRLVTSILSVVMIDTNWYETVVSPLLDAFCAKNGIKIDTPAQFAALKNGYHDEVLLGIIKPVSAWLNLFLKQPATTLIKSLQGVAGILDDSTNPNIASIFKSVAAPLANEIRGLGSIFAIKSDKLGATSPTLQSIINDLAVKIENTINPNNLVNGVTISGATIIPIINSKLAGIVTLRQFNWNKFSNLKTPAAALVYVVEYMYDIVLDIVANKFEDLTALINNDMVTSLLDLIKSREISARDILALIDRVLEATNSPTLAYWTFSRYLQEIKFDGFFYPAGITADMANNGVQSLDQLVSGLFPLLSSFGINIGDSLGAVLDNKLFTNELVTKAVTGIYGAIENSDKPLVKTILNAIGIPTSTKDVAKLLVDSSYGATYSSAANAISAQSNWTNVKNINWGFADGSEKAQQGFVNAMVAIFRPFNNILNVFLNEGALQLDDIAYDAICQINVPYTENTKDLVDNNKGVVTLKYSYSMQNGVLKIKFREDPANRTLSRPSELKIDFKSLRNLDDLKIMGTNAYNSSIIPLLEAFGCSDIQTYAQYKNSVANAKDNLLLGILNPLLGDTSGSFLNKLAEAPVSELTKVLPNVAMYLKADGIIQLVSNLLAPVTDLIGITGENANDIYYILEAVGLNEILGVKLTNLHNMIIPIVNSVLASKNINIKLPDIDWDAIIALGEETTYTSKATGADGNFLTGKIVGNVDQGKVLVTVLRYVANILVNNADGIKNIICNIDKLKNSDKADMIISLISSVFNTISTASDDQIVAAVFYLLAGNPRNAFWDYSKYKTGNYSFAYPETVDVDFLKQLPPMIDGLVGSLVAGKGGLTGIIGGALFKDELISKLAKGLYGAIEGVKINDNMNLTSLLAQTDIDFSTDTVAKLLVDEKYGQKYTSASAAISAAGSWKNVNVNSLKWGVTDRDSFFHALAAVLRPLYGVLDVLLNDAQLGLFDIVRIPGSNGYTAAIVPLMEAFSMYNIKTQYQYRQDINKEYDAILLDIINPLWDLVEDVLNAPLQTIAAIVPNLALFIGNNGLCQIFDNLLAPISALLDAIRPVVDLNTLLPTLFDALNFNLNGTLAKIGVKNFTLDLYDISKTLSPILAADSIIPLLNNILGIIKIGGKPLGLKLNQVDWLQLASHGTTIVSASQAATFGPRVFVQGDSSETLIAVLRYLINTINTGDNYEKIAALIGGLIGGGGNESVTGVVTNVLGMLKNDTDTVISDLVGLLETLA